MSRIEVRPQGGAEVEEYVDAVLGLKEELAQGGVSVDVFRTRAEPVVTTILVAVVGSVLSHYVIKLAERLVQKKKREPDDVRVVLLVERERYELPAEYDRLQKDLALLPGDEGGARSGETPSADA